MEGAQEKEVESERGKSKVLVVRREIVVHQVKVEVYLEIMEVVISFKYLGNCFSKYRVPQEYVNCRLGEGLEAFGVMNFMFNVRSVSLDLGAVGSLSAETSPQRPMIFRLYFFYCSEMF